MYNLHDPLLELEKSHTHKRSFGSSLFRTFRFLSIYLALTGTIFVVLLALLNASAYSSRIMNWVNPEALLTARDEVANILSSSSVEVHASEEEALEKKEDFESVKSKILLSDPEMVYAGEYDTKGLISHL